MLLIGCIRVCQCLCGFEDISCCTKCCIMCSGTFDVWFGAADDVHDLTPTQ